ncbi:hypothetical protein CI109_103728 [Kwoniella shandongensis]|uniref:ferric-chelate reductase (NADPH) n=1 Tax=Kwoniella shandongensis TaxID=1734106 RepID=A0A5M6CC65_9TREE|nr:uncharacterized protein CI109_000577 [Kwoniella shandongensis]KAA5531005.1 hypothetical protein CI109_000577 [Kwoniella shandongensis]
MPLMGDASLARILYGPSAVLADFAAAPTISVIPTSSAAAVNMTQVVKQQKAQQLALDIEVRNIVMVASAGILVFCMMIALPRFLARLRASSPSSSSRAVGGGDLQDGWCLRRNKREDRSKNHDEKLYPFASHACPNQQLQPPPHVNPILSYLPFSSSALLYSPFARFPNIVRSYMTLPQLCIVALFTFLLAFTMVFKSDLSSATQSKGYGRNFERSGDIAVALIPVVIALGVRGNIVGLCVGKGYETLKIFHKIVGRFVFIAVVVHVVVYYCKAGFKFENMPMFIIWGYVALLGMVVIVVTSLPVIRNAYYGLFRVCHTLGIIALLLGLAFHRDECIPFCIAGVGIYAISLFCTLTKTRLATAKIEALVGADTTIVTIPSLRSGWRAGQHVRIRVPALGPLHGFEAHPFSIASSPDGEGMVLMCKRAGDWTERLYQHAHGSNTETGETGRKITIIIEGPYGGPGNMLIPSFSSVLLVAGGSGITSTLGHAHDLITRAPTGVVRARTVDLVWLVRTEDMAKPLMGTLLDLVNDAKQWESTCSERKAKGLAYMQATALRVHIYVTRCPISSPINLLSHIVPDLPRVDFEKGGNLLEGGGRFSRVWIDNEKEQHLWRESILPMPDNIPSFNVTEPSTGNAPTLSGISVHPLRPSFTGMLDELAHETILRQIKSVTRPSGICVIACGPNEMVQSVRESVRLFEGHKKREVGGIELEEERFGY